MKFEDLTEREKEHLKRMWTVDRADWVLHDQNGHLLPLHLKLRAAGLIEDSEVHDYVVSKMQEAGVPVVDFIP